MDLELTGKTALVIGGSSGIGADLAEVFATEGCDVAVTYRESVAGAEQVATRVRELGRRSWVMPLDLARRTEVTDATRRTVDETGLLDLVVLCAGKNIVTPFADVTAAEWGELVEVNLTGPFLALQALAPAIRPGGSITTVASIAAHTGAPHHPHYAAAKAGLVNLTRSMARELAPAVRVNCVAPGITITPMGRDTIDALAPDYAQRNLLLQAYATSRRVAQAVAFVASPVNEFMTGTVVDVNSGRFLR
ncbi:SDR family oxidoreductase [Micromonospora sp. WMMD975]|uniref:SDR family NAD(P)-dependent oxidoreductase n=1 Tax=Micromonospora sp. WMMD975 TaxID=3016087 RepID=UPI00249A38D2|nr:SDR family oxidoreductase [Micromonospora sp. WMMD975]WFE33545.1 SDR family NAD(P)-dependent oxidoreductase [Micromonospora sp. WMMD975]